MSERHYALNVDWFWPCVVAIVIAAMYFDHDSDKDREATKRTIVAACASVDKPDLCIATMMDKLKGDR